MGAEGVSYILNVITRSFSQFYQFSSFLSRFFSQLYYDSDLHVRVLIVVITMGFNCWRRGVISAGNIGIQATTGVNRAIPHLNYKKR